MRAALALIVMLGGLGGLGGCSQILGIGDFGVAAKQDAPVDAYAVQQRAYLKASNTGMTDHFGQLAVSADGSTIAVGAAGEDSAATTINGNQADETKMDAGAVYIFVRSGTTWMQQAYIKADNTDAGDQFGASVALSADGNTLVVGANKEDSGAIGVGGNEALNATLDVGAAYVFTRTGVAWAKSGYLKGPASVAGDDVGFVVAISGDGLEIAVGAPLQDAPGVASSGAVYTYHFNGAVWASDGAAIKASNATSGTSPEFGITLALDMDGTTMIVGARFEDSISTGINGNQTNTGATDAGAAFVLARSGTTWTQQAYLKSSHTAAGDLFGQAVAIAGDGNTAIVGAPGQTASAGSTFVFTRSGTTWSAGPEVRPASVEAGDEFGSHVAISADGMTFGASSPFEDSGATGLGGDQNDNSVMDAGALFTFTRAGAQWMPGLYMKAAHPGMGDKLDYIGFGGAAVVAGASLEDSNATGVGGDETSDAATDSGCVYVVE